MAVAAARNEARIDRHTLNRLADAPPIPTPWSEEARRLFVDLFLAGRPAVDVVETLDQRGLWEPIIPEWADVRCKPQRNAYHRFTVDRHLAEAAANAAAVVDRVDRSDLLAVGALLHDIGKGYPGDHVDVGIEKVAVMGPRMGFTERDTEVLQQMVRHHLLLPDVATRRDLSDDDTIAHVAEAAGDLTTLRLLDALTEADSLATGPAAWGSWKEELVGVLVARTAHVLGGGELSDVASAAFPNPQHLALLAQRRRIIEGVDDRLTVVFPDRPGMFARVAGVLSLHGLQVLEAAVHTDDAGMALEAFRVEPGFGTTIVWDRVIRDIERALDGRLALEARLAERARVYSPTPSAPRADHQARGDRRQRPLAIGHGARGPHARCDGRAVAHHPGPARPRPRGHLRQDPDDGDRRRRLVLRDRWRGAEGDRPRPPRRGRASAALRPGRRGLTPPRIGSGP